MPNSAVLVISVAFFLVGLADCAQNWPNDRANSQRTGYIAESIGKVNKIEVIWEWNIVLASTYQYTPVYIYNSKAYLLMASCYLHVLDPKTGKLYETFDLLPNTTDPASRSCPVTALDDESGLIYAGGWAEANLYVVDWRSTPFTVKLIGRDCARDMATYSKQLYIASCWNGFSAWYPDGSQKSTGGRKRESLKVAVGGSDTVYAMGTSEEDGGQRFIEYNALTGGERWGMDFTSWSDYPVLVNDKMALVLNGADNKMTAIDLNARGVKWEVSTGASKCFDVSATTDGKAIYHNCAGGGELAAYDVETGTRLKSYGSLNSIAPIILDDVIIRQGIYGLYVHDKNTTRQVAGVSRKIAVMTADLRPLSYSDGVILFGTSVKLYAARLVYDPNYSSAPSLRDLKDPTFFVCLLISSFQLYFH